MVDPNDTDLGDLHPTEASPRFNAFYDRMREWQFGMEALRRLDDEDLIYIAGHRAFEYHPHGNTPAELQEAIGIQQKVRGNALRAKDELDRRNLARQLDALEASNRAVAESNEHIRKTARWTFVMAIGTVIAALIAVVALLVALARDDDSGGQANRDTTAITTTSTLDRN